MTVPAADNLRRIGVAIHCDLSGGQFHQITAAADMLDAIDALTMLHSSTLARDVQRLLHPEEQT